jgi:hypothetical protein
MGDKSLAALTLWECLDGRQRGRLAKQLKIKSKKLKLGQQSSGGSIAPTPTIAPHSHGVPGYVDVGITQASAEATLAVEWKIGADVWKQAQDEGAALYVTLHSHHAGDENEKSTPTDDKTHDLCRLPITTAEGTSCVRVVCVCE